MLTCLIWFLLLIVIAGVLVWALGALPLDPTIQSIGRVVLIVFFVILMVVVLLNCLGLWHGAGLGLPSPR